MRVERGAKSGLIPGFEIRQRVHATVIEVNRMAGNRRGDGRSLYVEDGKVNKSGTGRSNGVLYGPFPVRGVTRPGGAIRQRVRYPGTYPLINHPHQFHNRRKSVPLRLVEMRLSVGTFPSKPEERGPLVLARKPSEIRQSPPLPSQESHNAAYSRT